jgi:hypothetical protein
VPGVLPAVRRRLAAAARRKNFGHALAHILFAGAIVIPIVTWLAGSLVLLILRKAAPRPAATS